MDGTTSQHVPWVLVAVAAGSHTPVVLRPGDIVGRSETAALRLNEPQISEAHAMVSLRGGRLRLLALRGPLMVDGVRVKDVELEEGRVVGLGPPHTLTVLAVALPATVLALASDDHARLIPPPVASLCATGPALVPGCVPDADALLWSDGPGLRLRLAGLADRLLGDGDSFSIGTRQWRVIAVPIASANIAATTPTDRAWSAIVIQLRSGNVHVHHEGAVTAFDGMPAAILETLARQRRAHRWREIASGIWPDIDDDVKLRVLWDGAMGRLRKRMRSAGIRATLVRTDNLGNIELSLGPSDRVERA
jgi:hypothetical protein